MIKDLLKKITDNRHIADCCAWISNVLKPALDKIKALDVTQCYHAKNIIILWVAYLVVSALIYPNFTLASSAREVYSLLFVYGAVVFLFTDNKNSTPTSLTVISTTTAGIAPLLFYGNSFAVACTSLILIVIAEFVLLQYMQKSRLFDATIPVYMICENTEQAELCQHFSKLFRVLDVVVLSDQAKVKLASVSGLRKWMQRINRIPFYPFPRRFVCLSTQIDENDLLELMAVSAEFSVPLFKISNDSIADITEENLPYLSPVTFADFDKFTLSSQDGDELSSLVKSRKVYICFDGRSIILDFAYALLCSGAILTLLCETENLAAYAEHELSENRKCKNFKIRITNFDNIDFCGVKPDMLFCVMPIRMSNTRDNGMQEAFIKNVLETHRLMQSAQSAQIANIFMLSSAETNDVNNWVGATQKLGELLIQFAGTRNTRGKVKIIRIPEAITDSFGVLSQFASSIAQCGQINVRQAETDILYRNKDIVPLLVRAVAFSMKSYINQIYTIIPNRGISVSELIQYACNTFCLRKNLDVRVNYSSDLINENLNDFSTLTKDRLEKTDVANVFYSKAPNISLANYQNISNWTAARVNNMSARDLISTVYQCVSER